MDNLELPEVKKRKGLSVFFAIDPEYAGFKFSIEKRIFTLKLGYLVLRIMNVSEAQYNRIITVATLSEKNDISVINKD